MTENEGKNEGNDERTNMPSVENVVAGEDCLVFSDDRPKINVRRINETSQKRIWASGGPEKGVYYCDAIVLREDGTYLAGSSHKLS